MNSKSKLCSEFSFIILFKTTLLKWILKQSKSNQIIMKNSSSISQFNYKYSDSDSESDSDSFPYLGSVVPLGFEWNHHGIGYKCQRVLSDWFKTTSILTGMSWFWFIFYKKYFVKILVWKYNWVFCFQNGHNKFILFQNNSLNYNYLQYLIKILLEFNFSENCC